MTREIANLAPSRAIEWRYEILRHSKDYEARKHKQLVDFELPGLKTTVNILDGSKILDSHVVAGYADSVMNILGGLCDFCG